MSRHRIGMCISVFFFSRFSSYKATLYNLSDARRRAHEIIVMETEWNKLK